MLAYYKIVAFSYVLKKFTVTFVDKGSGETDLMSGKLEQLSVIRNGSKLYIF